MRQLGFETLEELLAAPVTTILDRFELFDEHGEPFDPSNLPGRAALAGERPASITIGWRNRDGEGERWSIIRSAPVFAADGSVLFAVNIFHDVTEHKLREGEREELLGRIEVERGLLEAVLRQMPAGVIIAEAPSGGSCWATSRSSGSGDTRSSRRPRSASTTRTKLSTRTVGRTPPRTGHSPGLSRQARSYGRSRSSTAGRRDVRRDGDRLLAGSRRGREHRRRRRYVPRRHGAPPA